MLGKRLAALSATEQGQAILVIDRHYRVSTLFIMILLVAAGLRLFHLGETSLWYDEIVTMRLARTRSPGQLLNRLGEIDATRAPLHPLLLQCWITVFGSSDQSGRAFSAICGVVTCALIYMIGSQNFRQSIGLWASWLCALSPLLVYYSRETRMYMWLTLVTSLAWSLLLSHARSPRVWKLGCYILSLIGLVYSHPLGLLMVGALALASLIFRRAFWLSGQRWLSIQLIVALAIMPWLAQYLDHPPESMSGLLPLRYLLGMPIGFIGGDFTILLACSFLIMYGMLGFHHNKTGHFQVQFNERIPSICLLIWLSVPPLVLYTYSRIAYPIFGPARYTLFVGPAYLILVARGLAKLPWYLGIGAAVTGTILSGVMLFENVYRSDLKADWNNLTAYLNRRDPGATVAVISVDPKGYTELETARYYLEPGRVVIPWSDHLLESMMSHRSIWVTVGLDHEQPARDMPTVLASKRAIQEVVNFVRLRLIKVNPVQTTPAAN